MREVYNLYYINEVEKGDPPHIVRAIEAHKGTKLPKGVICLDLVVLREQEELRAERARTVRQTTAQGHLISQEDCEARTDLVAIAADLPVGAVLYERIPQEELNQRAFAHFART